MIDLVASLILASQNVKTLCPPDDFVCRQVAIAQAGKRQKIMNGRGLEPGLNFSDSLETGGGEMSGGLDWTYKYRD
eukprot:g80889.t1